MIHAHILQFLEASDPIGPSLDVFKLAMLNRKMWKLVLNVYGLEDFEEFAINQAK